MYGTSLQYETPGSDTGSKPVSIIYALPSKTLSSSSFKPKGIVLLLHACTHNAYKFFSQSVDCTDCVGLSEELQISRWVLDQGYVAMAVTCFDDKSGCWGDAVDLRRIQLVLDNFVRKTHPDLFDVPSPRVFAVGASSGGAMAARLLVGGVVEAALVMVMGLPQTLLERLLQQQQSNDAPMRSLYLAPMVKDLGTTGKNQANYQFLTHEMVAHPNIKLKVQLDESSCRALPVTVDYLWRRVPGMTHDEARIIVETLIVGKHLDSVTHLLILDPTRSPWRDLLRSKNQSALPTLSQVVGNGRITQQSLPLLTFDLTPGRSPLAKALHRAWAFHEYCSESLAPAFALFEQ